MKNKTIVWLRICSNRTIRAKNDSFLSPKINYRQTLFKLIRFWSTFDKNQIVPLKSLILLIFSTILCIGFSSQLKSQTVSIAEGELLNVIDTVAENSMFGPIDVSVVCPYNIILDGSASSGENGYFIGLSEFDLMTWTNVTIFQDDWICTPCTAPNNIDINSFFPPNEPVTGKIYLLTLAVGPEWSTETIFFEIEGDQPTESPACPTDIVHIEPFMPQGQPYQSSNSITSDVVIETPENVLYDARNTIQLNPGFEVQPGAEFDAQINGCGPDYSSCIQLTDPHYQTIIHEAAPMFSWRVDLDSLPTCTTPLQYEITILKVNGETSLQQVINNNNVFFSQQFSLGSNAAQQRSFPSLNLQANKNYVWQLKLLSCSPNVVSCDWSHFFYTDTPDYLPFQIDENICDAGCPLLNDSGFESSPQGFWQSYSGSPYFDPIADGCDDAGYVTLNVSASGSDVISQQLRSPFNQDRHYQMSVCVKPEGENLRLQVVAFNGTPTSFSASADVAIIAQTGHIPPTTTWSTIVLPTWTANKNFDNIAIFAVDDGSTGGQGFMSIDNVCAAEVGENPCPPDFDFTIDIDGNIGYPDWLDNVISSFGLNVRETYTEIHDGSLVDIYGHKYDVTTNDWYTQDNPPCHSVGNIAIDSIAMDSVFQHVLDSAGVVIDSTEMENANSIYALVAQNQTRDSVVNGGATVDYNSLGTVNELNSQSATCLYFDGVDDVITTNFITNIPDYNAPPPLPPINYEFFEEHWTFDFRFKADATQISNAPTLISSLTETITPPFSFTFYSGFRVFFYDNGTDPFKTLAFEFVHPTNIGSPPVVFTIPNNGTAGNILDNTFHNVSLVRDNNDIYFYIDGNLEGVSLLPDMDPLGNPISVNIKNDTPLRIGNDLNNQGFKGVIRDVRIWNSSRSASDIQAGKFYQKRYSYTEQGLMLNFELFNLQDQRVHNNAGRFYPHSASFSSEFFHFGNLGINDQVNTEDPTLVTNCLLPCVTDFHEDITRPFGGRDIVFVHGLVLDHLCDELDPALDQYKGVWPADEDDFYEGDFQQKSVSTWKEHIIRELGSINNPSNNYMFASYNCAQRAGDGINAIAHQIKEAMETGRGVVWSQNNTDCVPRFGKEIVIISHSTGGLVVSSLLGLAEVTNPLNAAYNPAYNAVQGNLAQVTDNIKAHIGFTPALAGSPQARFAINVGQIQKTGGITTFLSNMLASLGLGSRCSSVNFLNLPPGTLSNAFDKSVLVDLYPTVADHQWAQNFYQYATVPTITVAGSFLGVPSDGVSLGEAIPSKYYIVPGMDDGVLTMDCVCARKPIQIPGTPLYTPSKFVSHPYFWKNFDLGNPISIKSIGQWREMYVTKSLFNNSCISGRTPSGMLTWMDTPANSGPSSRWANHYSFIQSTMYHYEPWDVDLNGYDYYEGVFDNLDNYEESLVITDPNIYNLGLVSQSIQNDMDQFRRRKTIGFHFLWVRKKKGFPWFEVYWKYFEIEIWKRTYHLLDDSVNNDAVSRVYEYVLK